MSPSATTTTDAARDASSSAYATRHPGRTAHADGTLAIMFASQAAMTELSRKTARALRNNEIDVEPWPRWVRAGVLQALIVNVLGLRGEVPSDLSAVIKSLRRIAQLPSTAAMFTPEWAQKSTEQMLRDTKTALFDPSRDGLRKSLELSRPVGVPDANVFQTADDVHARAVASGYAMEVRAAVLGHAEVLPRRGVGNQQNLLNENFLHGVLVHFAANKFVPPTSYDLADLSLAWGFEDVDRAKLRRRWKTRLSTPSAVEASREFAACFEGADNGDQGQPNAAET